MFLTAVSATAVSLCLLSLSLFLLTVKAVPAGRLYVHAGFVSFLPLSGLVLRMLESFSPTPISLPVLPLPSSLPAP